MALVSFNLNRMEIYISISSIKGEEKDKGVQTKEEEEEEEEGKSINVGKAQIFMDISHTKNSLKGIKILLSTPLSEEIMNAVRKTTKEKSEIKIS
jgi:hypothetical protein